MKVWSGKRRLENAPARSSLARLRKWISYLFFKDHFEKLVKKADAVRSTYLGLRIYAIDGQMLTLPKSKEITQAGFTGVSKDLRFTNRAREPGDLRPTVLWSEAREGALPPR
ncbi:MAG: hypothetical protein H7301_02900 [Cryobacterium sp.]|nr:hypothetical protein [Oligoflexia bacterium]